MIIQDQLLVEHTGANTKLIVDYISEDINVRYPEILECYKSQNLVIAQRASMVMNHIHDAFPEKSLEYQLEFVQLLEQPIIHDAIKRAGVRTLADQEIHEEQLGIVADFCFNFLNSTEDATAIKVHAMEILKNIVLRIPELRDELIFSLEEQYPYQTAGFKNRAKKILNKIRNV